MVHKDLVVRYRHRHLASSPMPTAKPDNPVKILVARSSAVIPFLVHEGQQPHDLAQLKDATQLAIITKK